MVNDDKKFLTAAFTIIVLSNLLIDDLLWRVYNVLTESDKYLDLEGQRALCAYTLHGIDPFPQIGVEPPLLPDVGVIPREWGTVPWGLILSNIFYPAFLSIDAATNYFLALNVIVLSATALVFYDAARKISPSLGVLSIALFILPASFMWSTLRSLNAGGMICCLVLICCVIVDRRPLLTGVLLSIAMIKPQTALPLCILFLMQGRWKVLLTAAAIDLGAWLTASALTATDPITLLLEMFNANIGGTHHFRGLMRLFFLTDSAMTMYSSMAVGVLFLLLTPRRSTGFMSMHTACVVPLFWSYTTGNDMFVLVLPTLCCLHLMLERRAERLKWFLTGMFFNFALLLFQSIEVYFIFFEPDEQSLPIRVCCFLARIIFCFPLICISWRLEWNLSESHERQ